MWLCDQYSIHINTKHPVLQQKTKAEESDLFSYGIYDLFQIEVLNGEHVCNKGFDSDVEVQKHIKIDHKDILIDINKNIEEDKDLDESEDEFLAFLSRFDDDGNIIHERKSRS